MLSYYINVYTIYTEDKPYSFYVGVEGTDNDNSFLTKKLMLRFLGDKVNKSEKECKTEDTVSTFGFFINGKK